MSKTKKLFLSILISLIAFAIFFMVLEFFFWVFEDNSDEEILAETFKKYSDLYKVSENKDVSFELKSNVNLTLNSIKGDFYTMDILTNSQGLREEKEIPFEKSPEKFRIIGLGDSIMFGASVNNDETFLKNLEKRNENIETINFGVGSSNPRHEYYFLKHKNAANYSPDLLLLSITYNDFDNRVRIFDPEIGNWYYEEIGPAKKESKSRVIRAVQKLFQKDEEIPITQQQIEQTKFWINSIKKYADENGMNFLLVLIPAKSEIQLTSYLPDGSLEKAALIETKYIEDICIDLKIDCIWPLVWLKINNANKGIDLDELYWDDIHPYKKGHEVIGEFIYLWLKNEGYVQDEQ